MPSLNNCNTRSQMALNILLYRTNKLQKKYVISWQYIFGLFGRPVYWFGCPNSRDQKTLSKFSFFSCISSFHMLKSRSIISQCIYLFRNDLENKNAHRREKQSGKEDKVKEETVNESLFIELTTWWIMRVFFFSFS